MRKQSLCRKQGLFSDHVTVFLGRDGPPTQSSESHSRPGEATAQIPDELRFRVHISQTVLCKSLVQTVECGSQEAPNEPHHDEETQIHSCPEMTFFIRVRALREEGRREKNQSSHENRRTGRRQKQE
jgi:hypothetical protein